jgi:hypothetical protein
MIWLRLSRSPRRRRSGDDVLNLFSALPFGAGTTRQTWEIKVAGLAVVFVYAFFKFAWAYRAPARSAARSITASEAPEPLGGTAPIRIAP